MRLTASEKETQAAILELLRLEGIYALRLNSGAVKVEGRFIRFHSGGAGVADIVAFCPHEWNGTLEHDHEENRPHVLWIEVKSATGKQSPEQKNFEENMSATGMHYLLARSLDDLSKWLQEHR